MRRFPTVPVLAMFTTLLFVSAGLAEGPDSSPRTTLVAEKEEIKADSIPMGYRVVSITVQALGVPEIVAPGDRVDVLLCVPSESGNADSEGSTHTLLQDIKVFGVSRVFDEALPADGATSSDATVALLVTPQQAERLLQAAESGKIRLTLRNPEDDARVDSQMLPHRQNDPFDEFGPVDDEGAEESEVAVPDPIMDLLDHVSGRNPVDERSGQEPVEVDLGEFAVTAFEPVAAVEWRIEFRLCATVDADRVTEFTALLEKNRHRFRDLVISIIRGADYQDLTDPALTLIKRKILEKTNRTLGESLVGTILFSDFSVVEQ